MRLAAFIIATVLLSLPVAAAQRPGVPPPAAAQAREIDRLFTALKNAESDDEAKSLEDRILAAFLRSGSPTIDLLMSRAAAALKGGDAATAKKLIASVTEIAPDYAEGWYQRGVMQAAAGDDQGAMFCFEKAVTLNPRHFAAMAELASKIEEYGDKPAALKLYRKALALDPHYMGLERKVRSLEHEVEGENL